MWGSRTVDWYWYDIWYLCIQNKHKMSSDNSLLVADWNPDGVNLFFVESQHVPDKTYAKIVAAQAAYATHTFELEDVDGVAKLLLKLIKRGKTEVVASNCARLSPSNRIPGPCLSVSVTLDESYYGVL